MTGPIRILIGKVGLDGHDRGALILTQALREKGMYTIYSGIRKTPEQIVRLAIDHNVQVIGISSLSGGHLQWIPEVTSIITKRTLTSIPVIVGGVIPEEHHHYLYDHGVNKIFTREQTVDDAANYITSLVRLDSNLG